MTKKEKSLLKRGRLSYVTVKQKREQSERSAITRHDVAQLIRDRAKTGEFWTILFSEKYAAFARRLTNTYYGDCETDCIGLRLSCVGLQQHGVEFLAMSLRKRMMLARTLRREIRDWVGVDCPEADLLCAHYVMAVEPQMVSLAAHVAQR